MLEFPEIVPTSMSINLISNSKLFQSKFNQSIVTHRFPGARWKMNMSFNNLDNTTKEIDILQSFIWGLDGVNGRFLCRPFGRIGSLPLGNPQVSQGNQSGSLLITRGWTPNQAVLKRGDFFSINNELKHIKTDIHSNAQGYATLKFSPSLRKSPNENTKITTFKPKGIFRLADNDQGEFNLEAGINANVQISIVEAFHV